MPDSNEKAIYYTLPSDTRDGDDFSNSVSDLHCFAVKLDSRHFCIVNMSSDGSSAAGDSSQQAATSENTVGSC